MAKKSSATKSRRGQLLKRFLLVAAAVVVVLGLAGAAGFYVFQGWRARDMAGKALESFEQANYRAAWLQMNSARNLRPNEPAVLRAVAIIESRFGMPSAMESWERLAERRNLSSEDLEERGRAAAALANDEQFERAVADLATAGQAAAAGRLRTVRSLARGNMDRAIEEARQSVATSDDPGMKLDLARLMLRRNVDRLAAAPQDPESQRIASEMFAIVDALQGTEAGPEALAFGLTFLLPGPEGQERWANLAMSDREATNPALLPAATVMVDLGKADATELHETLRPIFDAAPLERRAAFVAWMTRQGMPREALTLITAQEAGESAAAFIARTEALAKLGNWSAVIETADAGGKAPLSLRLASKARGEYGMGRGAQSGAKSLAVALRAAVREGTLPTIVALGDEMGGQGAVDVTLVELCGDPGAADEVFRLTRDRLSRRSATSQSFLVEAHARALVAAPNAVSVQDYTRYIKLLVPPDEEESDDEKVQANAVDPQETAKAVVVAPADPALRATHALALLRAGRAAEGVGAFEDLTVFYARVPPALQAVICRVLAESGQKDVAKKIVQSINKEQLTPQEMALLEGLY